MSASVSDIAYRIEDVNQIWLARKTYKILLTIILTVLMLVATDLPLFAQLIFMLTFYSFLNLIFSFGVGIPVKELAALLMVVQLLLAPYLDYFFMKPKGLTNMMVDSDTYFGFALPAVILFIFGMNARLTRYNRISGMRLLNLTEFENRNFSKIGVSLIAIGYFFFFFRNYFVIPGLEFVLVPLLLLRFIGLFYIFFSSNRYKWLYLIIVFIPALIYTIQTSIFIDLIIWTFFIYAFAAIKFKIKPITSVGIVVSVSVLLIILQTVKTQYRRQEWGYVNVEKQAEGFELFTELFSSSLKNIDDQRLFIMEVNMINRVNQGWIVSFILRKDPANTALLRTNYFYRELLGVFLPRILYPDKPVAGDNAKFRFLTGFPLATTVAMNVGILGDGFGNFGYWGGLLFCLGFGIFLNLGLRYCTRLSVKNISLLFWIPLIFFYAMRAGNEFYIIANWTVKVALIVYFYYLFAGKIVGKPV